MSRTKQILELESPNYKEKKESFRGLDQECRYCFGKGGFWGRSPKSTEDKFLTCPVCKGSGKMFPLITVEWLPVIPCGEAQGTVAGEAQGTVAG